MKNLLTCLLAGCIAVVVVLLPGTLAEAEIIHLKNGGRIDGRIVEQDAERVRVEVRTDTGRAIVSVERHRILRIEETPTFDQELTRAQQRLDDGETQVAEDAFRALVRREPRNGEARLGFAKALVTNYRYEEATKTLEHYLMLVQQNRNADVMLYLAEQYMHARDFRNARRVAREAGALYPQDADLQDRVASLVRTIERVRSGQEQLRERETAHQAEIRKLREHRAEWDEEKGNSREAEETATALIAWAGESHRELVKSGHLALNAPDDAMRGYYLGDDVASLRSRVSRCEFKLIVDERVWTAMYDRQKAVLINGWYYQLADLYPRSNPRVQVYTVTQERGREVEKLIARGTFDGRRDAVLVERWTERNPDPTRPARNVIIR